MIHLKAHCGEVAEDFNQVFALVPVVAEFGAKPGFALVWSDSPPNVLVPNSVAVLRRV